MISFQSLPADLLGQIVEFAIGAAHINGRDQHRKNDYAKANWNAPGHDSAADWGRKQILSKGNQQDVSVIYNQHSNCELPAKPPSILFQCTVIGIRCDFR